MSAIQATRLYTASQSRAVDAAAIETFDLPGPRLMARAARAAFSRLLQEMPEVRQLQVLCGPGNNGGDGLLLALLARDRGLSVRVFLVDGEPRSTDAIAAAGRARSAGLTLELFEPAALAAKGVVVDAMLGTGISGPPRDAYAAAIEAVNALNLPVLALDVPSGVDADTGAVAGAAIRARWTQSFITAKRGLYTAAGAECAGARFCDDLGVPGAAYELREPVCERLELSRELPVLPLRPLGAHKGNYGRCLLVGGDHGMGGAILLAAEAALRTGLGLARVATRGEHLGALLTRLPEAMAEAVEHRNTLMSMLAWADAVVVGPGLGTGPWGEQMLQACLASGKPLLLDADALNMLAVGARVALPVGSVITPHPGEAARLLGISSSELQADRFAAATRLASEFGASAVLKGNGSIVASDDRVALCSDGNPGMATGGMGDVLSGVIGGLLAQGLAAEAAARLGTVLHARAGDAAAERLGERALLASDLTAELAELIRA